MAIALAVLPRLAHAQFEAPKPVEDVDEIPRPRQPLKSPAQHPSPLSLPSSNDVDPDEVDSVEGLPGDTGPDPGQDKGSGEPAGQASSPPDAGPAVSPDAGAEDGGAVDAGAADGGATDGGMGDGGGVAALAEPIVLPRSSLESLLAAWEARRKAVAGRNPKAQSEAEVELAKEREELGIRDLFAMAGALDHEARGQIRARDPDEATRLAELAVSLAPDEPSAWLELARIDFAASASDAGTYLDALRHGLERMVVEPGPRKALLGNLLAALLFALGVASALGLAALFARQVRYAVHDFHHLFPRGALPAQTTVLFVLVLGLPLVFRLGPYVELALLTAAVFAYFSAIERAVATALLLALAGFAPLAGLAASACLHAGTRAEEIERVESGGPDAADAVERLSELEKQGKAAFPELFALGLNAKRLGRYDEAIDAFHRALTLNPTSAAAFDDLGNALLLEGDLDGAKDSYLKAVELAPESAIANYNLAKLFTRRAQLGGSSAADDIERGKSATAAVYRLDRSLMDRPADLRANGFVIDEELSDSALADASDAAQAGEQVSAQVRARLMGPLPRDWGLAAPLAIIALLWACFLAARPLWPSSECTRCGRAVCRRCDREVTGGTLCGQCLYVFTKKGAVDPPTRLRKEAAAKRYQARWAAVRRGASLMVAGGGHLLSGRPAPGLLFLVLALGMAYLILATPGVFRSPYGNGLGALKQGLAAAFLVLVYYLSIRSYRAGEDKR